MSSHSVSFVGGSPDSFQSSARGGFEFEHISTGQIDKQMSMSTPLGDVLDKLTHNATDGEPLRDFWYPAGLVRFAINNTTDKTPVSKIEAVRTATDLAIGFYEGRPSVSDLEAFRARLADEMYYSEGVVISQSRDNATVAATEASLSKIVARQIEKDAKGDVLHVPIGHGGIVTGIMTHLYLSRELPNPYIYPVRFSRLKQRDQSPRITDNEINLLRSLAQEQRSLVIQDEDSNSGNTLKIANECLSIWTGAAGKTYANLVSMP